MSPSTRPSVATPERGGAALGLLLALALTPAAVAQPSLGVTARPLPGLRAEAATLLVQGLPGGSLPMAAAALEERAGAAGDDSGRLRVPVLVELPGAALLAGRPAAAEPALTIELYVYGVTPEGAVAGWTGRAVTLDLAAVGEPLWSTGLKIGAALDLPPTALELRFLVLEPERRRFAVAVRSLDLSATGGIRLGRPLGIETCADWLAAGEAVTGASARPVFRAGAPARLAVPLAAPPGAASPEGFSVRLTPVTGGEPVAVPARVTGLRDTVSGRRIELELAIPALAEDVYELAVALGPDGADAISPPVESWILAAAPGADTAELVDPGCRESWSRVLGRAMTAAGTPSPTLPEVETEEAKRRGEARRRQAAAYAASLRRFAAAADLGAGAADLGRTEEAVYTIHREGPSLLLDAELEVAGALAGADAQALPALLMLHHQVYLEHLEARRFGLAGHSRDMVVALADLLLDRLPGDEGRSLAADMLASLGDYAERNRLLSLSRLLLERAIEIEPDHQPALIVLAVSYERGGLYSSAHRTLERLVELDPGNMEARLRLAVMLERTGTPRQAETELRTVLRRGASAWILSLAYQEMARLLLATDRVDEAATLLEQGARQLGEDRLIALQLAYAFDRSGRRRAAEQRLAELDLSHPLSRRTARHRYSEPPAAGLEAVRAALDRNVVVRLPLLARALAAAELPEAGS